MFFISSHFIDILYSEGRKGRFRFLQTETLNPKLKFFVFWGLRGVGGFCTYGLDKQIFLFAFLGFFFDGKMSDALMDERFKENSDKATIKAYRAGITAL